MNMDKSATLSAEFIPHSVFDDFHRELNVIATETGLSERELIDVARAVVSQRML